MTTQEIIEVIKGLTVLELNDLVNCLLYTSPSPRDA